MFVCVFVCTCVYNVIVSSRDCAEVSALCSVHASVWIGVCVGASVVMCVFGHVCVSAIVS